MSLLDDEADEDLAADESDLEAESVALFDEVSDDVSDDDVSDDDVSDDDVSDVDDDVDDALLEERASLR